MNILIVKLGAISDVMFVTPLVEALKRVHANPHIDWLVGRIAEPILRGHPDLRRRIIFNGFRGGLQGMATTAGRLLRVWRSNYDLVLVLERGGFFQAMAAFTESPKRVGYQGQLARICLTHAVPFDVEKHETERYLDTLRALDHNVVNTGLHLALTYEAQVTVDLLLQRAEGGPPYIAIAPGGGVNPLTTSLIKRWPVESYAQVARELRHRATVVVVGTKDEAAACAGVARAAGPAAINTCGELDLPQMAAMLARCDVTVANDSAPLHIAAAVGTPTVGIFGPTDPRRRAPLGPIHRYLWNPPPCGPCARPELVGPRHKWQCTRLEDPLRCLHDVTPAHVLEAIDEALAGVLWHETTPFRGVG